MSVEKNLHLSRPDRIKYHVPTDLKGKPYIEYYDAYGKRQRIYRGLSAPKTYEARVLLAEHTMYAFSASYIPALTLDDQAWAWLREQRPNWKKKSYSSYCSKLRNFLAWKGSKEISNGVIREFLGELRKTHSNGTRNDYLRFLKQIYSGVDAGHHFGKLKKLRHYPETCEHYRPSYIRTIFEHLEEHDQELLFACRCVMYLLVRPQSELRLLKVHNFDTDDWLVTIPSSVAKNHRRETVHVPLNFRARILEYLKGKGPNEYVFPGKKKGTPMGPNNLADRHRKSMNDLGFGMEYKMYGWKNTGNIEYKKAGADIYFISRQNRHSSLEITSIYFRKMGWDDRGTLPDLKIDY